VISRCVSTALAALLLTVCSAPAQWSGWPLADNTNAGSWRQFRDLYNPVSQLWYAACERYALAPSDADPGYQAHTLTITTSPTSGVQVVTNALGEVHTYTNLYLTSANVVLTNDIELAALWPLTGYAHTYTNATGAVHSVTSLPYITTDVSQGLVDYIDNAILYAADDASDKAPIDYFVCTNAAVGGSFNTWFAKTNAAGEHPDAFPFNSVVGTFHRDAIGYTTNRITDSFGHVISTNGFPRGGGNAAFTIWPANSVTVTLAQAVYTGAWSFLSIGPLGDSPDHCIFPDITPDPVLTYTAAGTNVLGAITATVYGTAITGFTCSATAPDITCTPGATTETVTVTTSNTALSQRWYAITNIVSAGAAPNTQDVLRVIWTNVVTYAWRQGLGERLWPEALDERYTYLKACVWTEGGGNTWTNGGITNYYTWTGSGAN